MQLAWPTQTGNSIDYCSVSKLGDSPAVFAFKQKSKANITITSSCNLSLKLLTYPSSFVVPLSVNFSCMLWLAKSQITKFSCSRDAHPESHSFPGKFWIMKLQILVPCPEKKNLSRLTISICWKICCCSLDLRRKNESDEREGWRGEVYKHWSNSRTWFLCADVMRSNKTWCCGGFSCRCRSTQYRRPWAWLSTLCYC